MSFRPAIAASLVMLVVTGSSSALAQPIGTFQWQLQPYCNALTVAVVQSGGVYTLDGYDDQCGAAVRAPLVGLATPNPDGTIGLGFSIVTTPSAQPVHVAASITLATVSGTWRDSTGATGTFAFLTGSPVAGSARPAATTVVYGSTLIQPAGAGDRGLSVRTSLDPGPITGDAAAIFGQWGANSGWGSPGSAGVRGDSASGAGVLGTTASGTAVAGVADTGIGVNAYAASGTGLLARTNAGTTAIHIDNGAIRVSGGVRPAFVHIAAAANITGNLTRLNHPLLNGDPNALVFVEHLYQPAPGNVYVPGGVGVYFDASADRWTIFTENPLDSMPVGARFNVLVIKQ